MRWSRWAAAAAAVVGVAAAGVAGAGPAGAATLTAPVVGIASTHAGHGYWLAAADGGVFSFGDARFHGSAAGTALSQPVVGIAPTPDDGGYWLAAGDGGVFTYGDATFHGSAANVKLNQPVVGIAATPDGGGYWLTAKDGGVFTYGDAGFFGSAGNLKLNAPVVGITATPDGKGYWLTAGDGGVFSFGDAHFYGGMAGKQLVRPVVGIARSGDGQGYWLAAGDGGVFSFGDAQFESSLPAQGIKPTPLPPPPPPPPAATPPGAATPPAPASASTRARIVALARSQLGYHDDGNYCTKYSSACEYWCSIFTTWVWGQVGIPIGILPFSGSVYGWSYRNAYVLAPSATPLPGDAVLFGTSPDSVNTSLHVGIVDQVFPSGAISVINGDYDHQVEEPPPFFPSQARAYGGAGAPIYAYASPVPRAADMASAAAAFPFPAPQLTAAQLRQAIANQDRGPSSRLRRLVLRAPAYEHLPYRTGTVRLTAVDTTPRGRVIVRVAYRGRRRAAQLAVRRFLRRYHDTGRDYVFVYRPVRR